MFLVELSYNTIKEEIVDLEKKRTAKKEALTDSSNQLEKDNKKLVDFIEKDNLATQTANKEAENAHNERKNKESQIRTLDAKIINVKSDIDKNLDQLSALETHKKFLFNIFEHEDAKWVEKIKAERERKLKVIRDKWLDKVKYTGVLEDEEFSEVTKTDGKSGASPNRRGKADAKGKTDEEYIEIFNQLLAKDAIDVPADYYDEPVLWDDPEDLMTLYSSLEDANRKRIDENGDINEEIEQQRQREIEIKAKIGGEIKT